MGRWKRFKCFLYALIKDVNFVFVLLAAILISVWFFCPAQVFYQQVANAFPYAFGWFVLAWAVTDRSILRRINPYLGIFLAFFIQRVYWNSLSSSLRYNGGYSHVSSLASNDTAYLSLSSIPIWDAPSLFYLFIVFVTTLLALTIIWYLVRPRDFTKLKAKTDVVKSKRMWLLGISAFLLTIYTQLRMFNDEIFAESPGASLIDLDVLYGVPLAFSLIIFAVVITNIERRLKFWLYGVVGFAAFVSTISSDALVFSTGVMMRYFSILVHASSYFFVFLCFLLLTKTRYLEQ